MLYSLPKKADLVPVQRQRLGAQELPDWRQDSQYDVYGISPAVPINR